MTSLVDLHKNLIGEWKKEASRNLQTVEKILVDVRVSFLSSTFTASIRNLQTALTTPAATQGLEPKALATIHREF